VQAFEEIVRIALDPQLLLGELAAGTVQ
jgi:hypothetical protein